MSKVAATSELPPQRVNSVFVSLLLTSVIVVAFYSISPLTFIDQKLYASLFPTGDAVSQDIVVLEIRDSTIARVGDLLKDRAELSKYLTTILAARPKVLAIDIWFRDVREPVGDLKLAEVIGRAENIVVPIVLAEGGRLYPELESSDLITGFVDLDYGSRSYIGVTHYPRLDLEYPTINFHLRVAETFLSTEGAILDREIWLDSLATADPTFSHLGDIFPVNYVGKESAFPFLPFEILVDRTSQDLERILRDRLVLVATDGRLFDDVHVTPISSKTSGGLILANAINTVVSNAKISVARPATLWISLLVFTYLFLRFETMVRERPLVVVAVIFLLIVIVAGVTVTLFDKFRFFFPVSPLVYVCAFLALTRPFRC